MGRKILRAWFLLICCVALGNLTPALSRDTAQPAFRITGYIEKIGPGHIRVFVPRMKQSLFMEISKNLKVTNLVQTDESHRYSLRDIKEKDLAVCSGVITAEGFLCQVISFLSNSDNHRP